MPETGFSTFSTSHIAALLLLSLIALVLIRIGKKADGEKKFNLGIIIAGLTLSTLIIEALVLLVFRQYEWRLDLPLFLCDLSAIFLPFVLFNQNRKWIGILYFWALAGTLQALITPELDRGFPSPEFFRYFAMHGGIIIAVLYAVFVFRINIDWKDFLNAILYAQFYLVVIHIFNYFLGTNYSYTMQKPSGGSILDLFGPWPWYILWGELLMVILFLLLMVPFLINKKGERGLVTSTEEGS